VNDDFWIGCAWMIALALAVLVLVLLVLQWT
jgi:hypothetical protein